MQETLNKQNMLNNLMLSEHVHSSKTLDLHHQGPAGVNKQPKDMNSFNAFSTVHRYVHKWSLLHSKIICLFVWHFIVTWP